MNSTRKKMQELQHRIKVVAKLVKHETTWAPMPTSEIEAVAFMKDLLIVFEICVEKSRFMMANPSRHVIIKAIKEVETYKERTMLYLGL